MDSDTHSGLYVKFLKWMDPLRIYDFEYWVYVFTGCWKYKSPEQWKTTLYKACQSFLALIYGSAGALYVMDAIAVKDDLEKLLFNMSSSFLLFVTIGKVFLLVKERDSLEDVYSKLNNHLQMKTIGVSREDKYILRRKAEILTTITLGFYTLLILGLPLRVIADTTLEPKAYLIPMPYRERVDPYYGYVYAPQTVIILHFLVVVLSHDLLVFSVLIRLIGHYEILAQNFRNIKTLYTRSNTQKAEQGFDGEHELSDEQGEIINDILIRKRSDFEKFGRFLRNHTLHGYSAVDWSDNIERRERSAHQLLKETLRYHQILLRETNTFCQLYSLPLLVQCCCVGILIAIVTLQIFFISKQMTTLLIEQVMFTVTLLWNVFFLCSFATELNTKSSMAATALYGTPWYEMDIKNRRIVQFAMKKLMNGPTLKGGNMVVVNRVTYLKFFKISYNVIAVLRHFY